MKLAQESIIKRQENATDIYSKLEWIYIELQMALTTKDMSQYFMAAMAS